MYLGDDQNRDNSEAEAGTVGNVETGWDGANKHEHLAYEYGQNYVKPLLSEAATVVGGYTCDVKPTDFDNQCLVRSAEPPIAEETIGCGVKSNFMDAGVFTDTNVLLEILQNAEPNDSKGTWFGLEFFAAGQWRSVVEEIGRFRDSEIEAVRISDNGKGYMPKDMTTLGGAKRDDKTSAGRFGSGMKVSDRSALGKGVEVKRFSRNWRATPFLEPVLTSSGWDQTVSYRVEYLAGMHQGSVVEYRRVTPEMIGALSKIEEIYLPLDRTFKERLIAETDVGFLLKPRGESGSVMVNGRRYTLTVAPRHPLRFSYDLHDVAIDDQNRHYVDASKAAVNICEIWSRVKDPELFQGLVNAVQSDQEFYELDMPGMIRIPDCFLEVVARTLGIRDLRLAYIKDSDLGEKDEQVLKRRGYKCIDSKLTKYRFFSETFKNMGVTSGKKLIDRVTDSFYGEGIDPYKGETFISSVCHGIVSVKNLKEFRDDEKETVVCLRDDTTGEEMEIAYSEFLRNKPRAGLRPVMLICRVKGDCLRSNRGNSQVDYYSLVSRFKDFLASCSAASVDASVVNGNLELNPDQPSSLFAIYKVRHWKNFPLGNCEVRIHLENTSQANEIGKIGEYSLDMNPDYKPVARTSHGDVVSLSGGLLYDQGIRDLHPKLGNILSYNFTSERESRFGGVGNIRAILSEVENADVAEAVLSRAKEAGSEVFFPEYGFLPKVVGVEKVWVAAFEKIFGENTVVDDSRELDGRCLDSVGSVGGKSGIKKVRLQDHLAHTLLNCGVKALSAAVRGKRVTEYAPNPLQNALLMVNRIVDRALEVSLPHDMEVFTPEVRTVKAVYNRYGQSITDGYGYQDPTLADPTIYVFDEGIQQSKISNLLTFILQKRIEVYRKHMGEDEYIEFKASVMAVAERSITSLEFLRKVRLALFGKKERIVELVDRVVKDIPRVGRDDRSKGFRLASESDRGLLSIRGLREALKGKGKSIGLVTAVTACGVLALVSGKFPIDKLAEVGWLKSFVSKSRGAVFNRSWRSRDSEVSVSIGRANSSERRRLTREQKKADRTSFISVPDLSWGTFLNESPLNKYNGKGWSSDLEATDFQNPQYSNVTRIAHMQKVSSDQETVFLRPLSGGYVDPASIILHKSDGTEVKGVFMTPGIYGSYEVNIGNQDDVIAVSYHNLMPSGWMEDAEKLTDEDFKGLSRDVYKYHTKTPDLDLAKIRFSSDIVPQAKNLQEFFDYLYTVTPLQRLSLIHKVVGEMRYTRNERTEAAFQMFHRGELPEKDFLEFVLNSDELENPGDGDCDVQNSIFALFARYAGIPAKIDFVYTDTGAGHGPATVFLPGIGWVIMDSMGERVVTESFQNTEFTDNPGGSLDDEDKAQNELLRILERRQKFEDLGCGDLQ